MSHLDSMIVNLKLPLFILGLEFKKSVIVLKCFFHSILDLHCFLSAYQIMSDGLFLICEQRRRKLHVCLLAESYLLTIFPWR